MWELSLAGASLEVRPAGRWLCSMVDPSDWPVDRRSCSPPALPAPAAAPEPDAADDDDVPDADVEGRGAAADVAVTAANGSPAAAMAAGGRVPQAGPGRRRRQQGGGGGGGASGAGRGEEDGGGGDGTGGGQGWHPKWGDRETALAFVGVGLRGDGGGAGGAVGQGLGSGAPGGGGGRELLRRLRACLLSAAEEAQGEVAWEAYDDEEWLQFLEAY